jgi:biopolymer transport protein ExbD
MYRQERATYDRLFYLRRKFPSKTRPVRGILEVAPWVNVVLLVLLFFIVNSSHVMRPGIMMDLPAAPMVDGARYDAMVVTVTEDNMMFFEDERTTLEGLAPRLAEASRQRPDSALVIEADARVQNRTLVGIYNTAAAAGLKKVMLATRLAAPAP